MSGARLLRTAAAALLLAGGLLALASCPNPLQSTDLQKAIKEEVDLATARTLRLTVEASAYAILSPSGTVNAKEGFPVALGATPFPTHALIGWRQTGGSGTVTFSQGEGGVEARLSGGDATVAPILVEKPKVLYSMPIGNNIALNSNIAVAFSSQINFDSINLSTFQLLKSGSEQVKAGQFYLSADGKTVGFNPDGELGVFSNYVISIASDVAGFLNLEEYQQGNAILIDQSLLVSSGYTAAFRTGLVPDTDPPMVGTFTVIGTGGDPFYTGSAEVQLTDISADDDAGIALTLVRNAGDADYQAFAYQTNPVIPWTVPFSDGRKEIDVLFEDWNSQRTPEGSRFIRYIVVDAQPPTGTVLVDGHSGPLPEHVSSGTVSLTLSASDPDADTGIKGSGESANGTDTMERKQMRFGNSANEVETADWEAYAASRADWSLGAATEGFKTVYAQFKDAVGNVSATTSDRVYLDVTPPTGSFQLAGGGLLTNVPAVTLTLSVYEDPLASGLDTLQINDSLGLEGGSAWSAGASNGMLNGKGPTAPFPYDSALSVVLDSAADGDKVVNLCVADRIGNTRVITQTLIYDNTDPVGGAVVINNGAVRATSPHVTLAVQWPTNDLTGISYMGFSNTAADPPVTWLPVASTASWTLDTIAPESDPRTVCVWFRDGAGNNSVAANASDTITLDTSPPSGSITVSPNPSASPTVTITSFITDAVLMRFSNNGISWSTPEAYSATKAGWSLTDVTYGGSTANGTRTVYAQFSDDGTWSAGLITSTSASLTFDNTPPAATVTINAGAAAANNGTVTLNLTASDNVYAAGSLLMQFSNNGATWSPWEIYSATKSWSLTSMTYGGSSAQGTRTVYARVKDPLGNGDTIDRSDTIIYDTTSPLSGTPSINAGAAYTNLSTVTLTLNASDSGGSALYQMRFSNNNAAWSPWEAYTATKSGWGITSATYGGTTTEGAKAVYVQVSDAAGNVSSSAADTIVYDVTPPAGGFTIESGNPATSVYTAAILYFSLADSGSGMYQRRMWNGTVWEAWEAYSTSKLWYLLPGNGLKTVYAQFMDRAGNVTGALYDQVTLNESYLSLGRNDIAYYGDAYMSTAAISGSDDFNSSPLAAGSVLVYKTKTGLIGKLEVVSFNKTEGTFPLYTYNVLTINLTTYNASGGIVMQRSNLKIRGTYSCDLDAGAETSSGADFQWRQDTSTVRYLVPINGAKFDKWK